MLKSKKNNVDSSKSLPVKKIAPKFLNEDQEWTWLIQRDFGEDSLNVYNRQKMRISGIESPKKYYAHLFYTFDARIEDLLAFMNTFLKDMPFKKEEDKTKFLNYKNHINGKCNILNEWLKLTTQNKQKTIKHGYDTYNDIVSFIALYEYTVPYHYGHALSHALLYGFSLTALSIVNLSKLNINKYSIEFVDNVPIIDAIRHDKTGSVTMAMLDRSDLNLFVKYKIGINVFSAAKTKELKAKLLYMMLKSSDADCAAKILPLVSYSRIYKEDVFQHIKSLIEDTRDITEKLNILHNCIAIENANYSSALSYYLHVVRSDNDVIEKIRELIKSIQQDAKTKPKIEISHPKIKAKDLPYWPVDDENSTDWLRKSTDHILTLEQYENRYCIENGLISERIYPKYIAPETKSTAVNQVPVPVQKQEHEPNTKRNIVTMLLVSLTLGLGAGLTLGFGFDLSLATGAIGASVSMAASFILMAGTYFMIQKNDIDMQLPPIVPQTYSLGLIENHTHQMKYNKVPQINSNGNQLNISNSNNWSTLNRVF